LLAFDAAVRGVPVRVLPSRLVWKTRMVGLPDGKKNFEDMYNLLIEYRRVTDRLTDILPRTVRTMHMRLYIAQ